MKLNSSLVGEYLQLRFAQSPKLQRAPPDKERRPVANAAGMQARI